MPESVNPQPNMCSVKVVKCFDGVNAYQPGAVRSGDGSSHASRFDFIILFNLTLAIIKRDATGSTQ
jgi:hypothetical protein